MSSWRRSTELVAAISRRQCQLAHVNQVCEGWHSYQTSSKLLAKFATRLTQRTNQIPAKRERPISWPFFPGLPGWAGTRKVKPIWILLKQETVSGSGISWAVCKSAPRCRQITMPAPHHSVFYRPDALPATNQQRQCTEGKYPRNDRVIYYQFSTLTLTLNPKPDIANLAQS